MLKKLTKVEITLCGLLGLVLIAGIGAALADLLGLSIIAVLLTIGLSAVLVVKNGNRLGYLSSKTKYLTTKLKDIEDSVELIQEEHQEYGRESLDFLKHSVAQMKHVATENDRQNQINREQVGSIQKSLTATIQTNHQFQVQETNKLSADVKSLRDHLQRISNLGEAISNRSHELQDLVKERTLLTQSILAHRLESEIGRCVGATSQSREELQTSLVKLGRDLEVKIDELGASVKAVGNSATDLSEAQTAKLDARLASTTEVLRSIPTLLKELDSTDQVRTLSNTVNAMEVSTKAEINSLLVGMQEANLSESTVEKLAAVTAREGLQTRRQLRRHVTDTVRDSTRQIEAIAKLMPRLQQVNPLIPSTGGFALDAQALLHLIDVLERVRPSTIVEFGGGTSTIWMAYICKQYNTRIISIDHLEEYLEQTRSEVARHGFSEMVECKLAPLETLEVNGAEYSWYSVTALADVSEVDLLFIDGPPESTGTNARRPAMHVMSEKLRPNAVVILDDAHRESEQETIQEWVSAYPEFEVVDKHVSRLAVLEARIPISL